MVLGLTNQCQGSKGLKIATFDIYLLVGIVGILHNFNYPLRHDQRDVLKALNQNLKIKIDKKIVAEHWSVATKYQFPEQYDQR